MLDILLLFAEEGTKPTPPGGVMPFEPMLLMLGVFALLYFIVLRPANKRQERERQNLLNNMKKNDRVITSAGIYGTVVSVSDKEDEVVVKVDDNTRLKMLKSSILRNLSGEEALKAEADKAKESK
jgi:preprotein translocase subunit YajC